MKKTILIIVILVVIINLPPLKLITGPDDIRYSNAGGTFTFDEANVSGRNYQLCMENFKAFKSINKTDTLLFRITPINAFKFWRWADYLSEDKYKLTYKSWEEIDKQRGSVENKTNWQSF